MVQHNQLGQCALGVDDIGRVSRRTWLVGALLGLSAAYGPIRPGFSQRVKAGQSNGDSDTAEIEQVQAIAKKAGLARFSHKSTAHFLGIGDAEARFRTDALNICESLAPVFLQHFNAKEFKLALPKNRLTVITLKSAESYKAFIGEDPGAIRGGHYDLDTNRLVMFDFRPEGEEAGVVNDPTRVNRMTLVHEATHLLCFNTGLLSRQTNVPDWVSEGLATYVEMWRNKQTKIGEPNVLRLSPLITVKSNGTMIPIADLVASDKPFDDARTAQTAYGESWLLVHYLMKSHEQMPKFRAYLAGLASEEAAAKRVEFAEKHLGSLEKLSRDLDRYLKRVGR
jgi:hypothetical protein